MQKRFAVFGFPALPLDEAAAFVEDALGIALEQRDSAYRGLYYMSGRQSRGVMLYRNRTAEGWFRPEFQGYDIILTAAGLDAMDEIERKLVAGGQAALLKSGALDEEDSD